MRVAFVGDSRHPNTTLWISDLAGHQGHEVHLVDFHPPPLGLENVRFHRLRWPGFLGKVRFIVASGTLKRRIREIAPDVVVAYRIVSYGFMAAKAGYRPLVLAAQGQNIVWKRRSRTQRWFAQYALRRADLIHAWSRPQERALLGLGARADRILLRARGVQPYFLEPPPPPTSTRPPIVITTRQLEKAYRIDVIISAIEGARTTYPSVELWVVGDGRERHALERQAATGVSAGSVKFFGRVENRNLRPLLDRASIYVSSVPTDGVSTSLLEAMARGVYPVVVENPANTEWITPGMNGDLYPAGDVERLARAIAEALADRARLSSAAEYNSNVVRERADWRQSMDAFAKAWENLGK